MARLDASRGAYYGAIVVLAEKDKAWMDAQIEDALDGAPPIEVRHSLLLLLRPKPCCFKFWALWRQSNVLAAECFNTARQWV